MENTTPIVSSFIVDGNSVAIESLRQDVADTAVRQYGAEKRYATALNTLFAFDWFSIEAADLKKPDDNGKALKEEKDALFKVLKDANHTNPSTVWARIRKYGSEARHGKPEDAAKDGEGSDGDGKESGTPTRERSAMLRNIEELTDLFKFNRRKDGDIPMDHQEKIRSAQVHIAKALEALGVKVESIQ